MLLLSATSFVPIIDCDILRQHAPQSCQYPLAKPKLTILIGLCAIMTKKKPWLEFETHTKPEQME